MANITPENVADNNGCELDDTAPRAMKETCINNNTIDR
eukprot:CAMPEP_0168606090 /NCGR_PEP_ID=MMETSP0420-20121227/16350_1 /TAXON_ID=498008 /ORGANISM="Pessonella sp." /LENGTH=37 /DNA_ID= /DNA_START= /DNA_END= /DNA_ORIENTATION=